MRFRRSFSRLGERLGVGLHGRGGGLSSDSTYGDANAVALTETTVDLYTDEVCRPPTSCLAGHCPNDVSLRCPRTVSHDLDHGDFQQRARQ